MISFYQHIYGRVSRGVQGESPGYQLAAVSAEIAEEVNLIDSINRHYSFFESRDDEEARTRYSFFRPAKGYLGFGASRYAMGLDGAIGSFAHNYICREKDFIQSGLTPADLLFSFSFYENEESLPQDRILPVVQRGYSMDLSISSTKWQHFGQELRKFTFESILVIPMVVVSEADAKDILLEMYKGLPRKEMSGLSFSTYFIAPNVTGTFRLTFVPSPEHLPRSTAGYRIIMPILEDGDVNEASSRRRGIEIYRPNQPIVRTNSPLARFWDENAEEDNACLARFLDILRHEPERIEEEQTARDFEYLLKKGPIFRQCLQASNAANLWNLVLRKPEWFVSYYSLGEPITYDTIQVPIANNLEYNLITVLSAVHTLEDLSLRDGILKDMTAQMLDGMHRAPYFRILAQTNHLDTFYRQATNRLNTRKLCLLGSRLQKEPDYNGQIHLFLANKMLKILFDSPSSKAEFIHSWLINSRHLDLPYISLIITMYRSFKKGKFRNEFQVSSFPISNAEYENVIRQTVYNWREGKVTNNMSTLFDYFFSSDYRTTFFQTILPLWPGLERAQKIELLDVIATKIAPTPSEITAIVNYLKQEKQAVDFLGFFKERLLKNRYKDLDGIAQLENIETQNRKGLIYRIFGGLFGP